MTPATPTAKSSSRPERTRRRWSLLWLLPERTARRLSWMVVILLGVLPLAFVSWQAWRVRSGAWEKQTEARLSAALGSPVSFARTRLVAPGHSGIGDVRIGATDGAISLSAEQGTFQEPVEGQPGRLILQRGKLTVDLDWWTDRTDGASIENLLTQRLVESLTLSGFDATFRLGGREVVLRDFVGVATVCEQALGGSFAARGESEEIIIRFDITDENRILYVRADALPWVADLLSPTLGRTLVTMLGRCGGTLELGPALETGTTEGASWRLKDLHGGLDLSALPERYGLQGVTGTLDVTVSRAFGHPGGPATFEATLQSAEGEGGTIPAAAIQRLYYLFTGREIPPLKRDARFESLKLHVVFTEQHLYISGDVDLLPSDGKEPREKVRMSLPGDGTALRALSRRLRELERRWVREAHTS